MLLEAAVPTELADGATSHFLSGPASASSGPAIIVVAGTLLLLRGSWHWRGALGKTKDSAADAAIECMPCLCDGVLGDWCLVRKSRRRFWLVLDIDLPVALALTTPIIPP